MQQSIVVSWFWLFKPYHFFIKIYCKLIEYRNVKLTAFLLPFIENWASHLWDISLSFICIGMWAFPLQCNACMCTWNFQYTFSTGGFERTLHCRYTVSPTFTTFPGPAFVRDSVTFGGSVIIRMLMYFRQKIKCLLNNMSYLYTTIVYYQEHITFPFLSPYQPSIAHLHATLIFHWSSTVFVDTWRFLALQ